MTAHYYRGYTFTCLCGRRVSGQYEITEKEFRLIGTPDQLPLDKAKAVCLSTKGAPNFPSWSVATRNSVGPHSVGCGKTLADHDDAVAQLLGREVEA